MSVDKTGFLKTFPFLLIFISLIIYIFSLTGPGIYVHDRIWLCQLFFMVIVPAGALINNYAAKHRPEELHMFYILSLTIRFLAGMIFIFVLLFLTASGRVILAVNFFILYLLYTWFEIYFLLRNLRTDSQK